jgi:type IV pilus assembly protein PilW
MKCNKTIGFTLLEIMITLSLGLFLVLGIYELLQTAKQNFNYIQGISTVQENGQLAALLLRQQITQAGYAGCRRVDKNFQIISRIPTLTLNTNNVIRGYDSKTIGNYSKDIAKKIVLNTDAITIAAMDKVTTNLTKSVTQGNTHLSLTNPITIKANDAVMLADCKHAELNTAAATVKNTELIVHAPIYGYAAGANVAKYMEDTFYIGKTERVNTAGNPINALYIHHVNGVDEELIEGVDALKIYYATLADKHKLQLVTANAVQDWSAIKIVQIYILLDSLEPLLAQPQTIQFANKTWQAPDRRLYKQWVITINLPNR